MNFFQLRQNSARCNSNETEFWCVEGHVFYKQNDAPKLFLLSCETDIEQTRIENGGLD